MTLKMRCQHCSAFKELECKSVHNLVDLKPKIDQIQWKFHIKNDSSYTYIMYFCSNECEEKFNNFKRLSSQIIGSISR